KIIFRFNPDGQAFRNATTDVVQIRLARFRFRAEEYFRDDTINIASSDDPAFHPNHFAKSLSEIRMARGPIDDPLRQGGSDFRIFVEALAKRRAFFELEVLQLNAASDIERGEVCIGDQLHRIRGAYQDKANFLKARIRRAAIKEMPNAREEFIGRKWEAP